MKQIRYAFRSVDGLIFLMIAVVVMSLMTGCAGIQPRSFTESLVATETAATTARQVGMQAALAGKLTKGQATFVQSQADLIVAGVKEARQLALSDLTKAENQYQMTANILAALQSFLVKQGAVK